jgi:hypothetical protein
MDPRLGRYLHVVSDKPALTVKTSPFYGFLFSNVTSFLHNILTSPVKTRFSNVVSSSERGGDKKFPKMKMKYSWILFHFSPSALQSTLNGSHKTSRFTAQIIQTSFRLIIGINETGDTFPMRSYNRIARISVKVQYVLQTGDGVAQSVLRFTTGWTVRGSNPGCVEIFRTRPDRPWGPPSLLYNGCRVFPGGKAAEAWC